MKAVTIGGRGGPEVLDLREVPTPEPQGAEIRVRVRAAGVNRADLMQAQGSYPAPPGAPADIPGLEFAGEVEALGPGVLGSVKVGDRVFGIVGGGAFAESLTTHERMVAAIPDGLDFEAAGSVPEAFLTALDALEARAEVRPGQRVLIQAVAGGIGTAAVQLAHAIGCTTFGTSRTAWKLERAAGLGLDLGIDAGREDVEAVVRERTGGMGVHAILDHLGAPALAANLAMLAPLGRLVVIGLLGGPEAPVDLGLILRRRLTIVGTALRSRPLEEKIAVTRRFAECVVPWLARGVVRPVVDRVYPLGEARAAVGRMASNGGFGRVVLKI